MENNQILDKNEVAKKLVKRRKMIQIVYRFFLVNEDVSKIKQEILDDSQLDDLTENDKNTINELIDFIPSAIEQISKFLQVNWRWNRLPKIIQSILVVATFEMKCLKVAPAIIINSSVIMTREYLPSWDERFVNAVLDKVAKDGGNDE